MPKSKRATTEQLASPSNKGDGLKQHTYSERVAQVLADSGPTPRFSNFFAIQD